jgi:hypothetical protein
MTESILETRIKVAARQQLCSIAREIIAEGDIKKRDLPFNLDNPGNDPRFHQICNAITVQMMDTMSELVCSALTEEY